MTFTEDGSQKVKVSPTGSTEVAKALSVTIAKDQPLTPDGRAIVGALEQINETLNKILIAVS